MWVPAAIGALQAGIGLYGSYKQRKQEKRAEKRGPIVERTNLLNPQQQNYYDMINSIITGQGQQPQGGLLGEVFGEEGFNKAYAEPVMRMYNEEIIPKLAERFSGAFGSGAASAQNSSAFQQALANQGSQLAQSLGEFRQRQRLGSLSGLTNQLMQRTENINIKQPHAGSGLGQGLVDLGASGGSKFFEELTNWLQTKYGASSNPSKGFGKPMGAPQGSYIDKFGNITGPMYK